MILTAIIASLVAIGTGSTVAQARTKQLTSAKIQRVICIVFKSHCYEALKVAYCESRFNIWARNGQYLGLFQMGSHERELFGYGNNPWVQAKAAHRYFSYEIRHNAYGWAPWQCKP